jgi:ketosteroid isomerase-like protein
VGISEQDVEVVRRWYEAVSRGDLDALMELVPSDVEFVNENIPPGTYRGREQIRKMFEAIWEVVEDYRVEPEELIEHGDQIVVSLRVSGRFRHTGISEGAGIRAENMGHVLTIRNGKIVRNRVCRDKARALEAVGLGE